MNETLSELVGEISELLVPPEKYDQEDAVVEVPTGPSVPYQHSTSRWYLGLEELKPAFLLKRFSICIWNIQGI